MRLRRLNPGRITNEVNDSFVPSYVRGARRQTACAPPVDRLFALPVDLEYNADMIPPPFRSAARSRRAPALIAALLLTVATSAIAQDAAEPRTQPGIRATFVSNAAADARVDDSVLLYVPDGQSPTAFLPAGGFQCVWEGFISVDLRDRYTFRVEANGPFEVEINDSVALEGTGSDGKPSEPSKRIRLGKGNNKLKVSFTSPESGDALFRLHWSSPDFDFEPIPARALSHVDDDALKRASALRRGRELFVERRCHKCHSASVPAAGMLELALDAPTFGGIGSRRNADWMRRWILDPGGFRHASIVRMPKTLHGPSAAKDAAAAASYLATLKSPGSGENGNGSADEGSTLFATLHCEACHQKPGTHDSEDAKISLNFVNQKFAAGALAAFLQNPAKHYAWIRMPDFKLNDKESAGLAAFLRANAKAAPATGATTPGDIAHGREIVETRGCLNCHAGPGKNSRVAPVALKNLAAGCLADSFTAGSGAVEYDLAQDERAALRSFISSGASSLSRHVPAEFAERQIRQVGCAKCHGQFDGFPKLDSLGGKLKPEWSEAFIAGRIDDKPRYWMPARMPAFGARARGIAHGMAAHHGYGPSTPAAPAIDSEMAAAGRKMVGTDGGFSCIACHAVKEFGAQQVFESAGINFGQVGARLQKPFFQRWLMNPLRVDPGTKMPVYFAGGQSPLFDFYEGDAKKQIDAFWEYIRQGEGMPLPEEATH